MSPASTLYVTFLLLSLIVSDTLFGNKLYAAQVIRYPQAGEVFTDHHRYPIELLKLALSYSPEQIDIAPSTHFMTQGRAIKQLQLGKDIDVMWTMTSEDREREVRPVRIPIYKGLIGWRLFLTTKEHIALKRPLPADKLKSIYMVQGHDWPDTEILRYNGYNVVSGPDYEGLFKVLSLNRVKLFPRSIVEIWDELKNHGDSNIVLEPELIISYPTATYFFVAPDNTKLAQRLTQGLKQAHVDGRFDHLFQRYHGHLIAKARLDKRKHFRLINPLLPKDTPLHDKSLWFSLDQD